MAAEWWGRSANVTSHLYPYYLIGFTFVYINGTVNNAAAHHNVDSGASHAIGG